MSTTAQASDDLAGRLVEFVGALRSKGVPAGTSETVDAAAVMEVLGLDRRELLREGLLGSRLHVRLVDLHDVCARCEEIDDLAVNRSGIGKRALRVGVEVVVLRLLRHRERPRDRYLDPLARVRTQKLHVAHLDRVHPLDRADHARYRIGMTAAIEGRSRVVDIDARERRRKAVRVALPAHLAVGEDVDPGQLLIADSEERGVVLCLLEVRGVDPPELHRPHPRRKAVTKSLPVDQPIGLGVRADDPGGDRVRSVPRRH